MTQPRGPTTPPSASLHHLRDARQLHRAGELRAALSGYLAALGDDPNCLEALHGIGVVALRLGDSHLALEHLGRAIQIAPRLGELYSAYGEAWIAAGQPDQAVWALKRAVELRPGRWQGFLALGAAQVKVGQWSDAVGSFRQSISLGGDSADLHYQLGHALLHERGDNAATAACEAAREAIKRKPDLPEAHHLLGQALGMIGLHDESIAAFQTAVELRPAAVAPWQGLGSALTAAGQFDEARRAFGKALKIEPDCFEAMRGLAIASSRAGNLQDAIQFFERALAGRSDDPATLGDLATALEQAGRREEAAARFEQLLRLRPEDADARFHLAALTGQAAPPAAPIGRVAALFDQYADTFDRHLTDTLGYQTPKLLFEAVMAAGVQTEPRVLDLGCGTGLCGPLFRPIASMLSGIDLSAAMIEKARQVGCYDRLDVGDLRSALQQTAAPYDLLIAADVFVYMGDLSDIHNHAAAALAPGGLFAYSVEAFDGPGEYELRPTRRYAHSIQYLDVLASKSGLERVSLTQAPIRVEHGQAILGFIVVLKKP